MTAAPEYSAQVISFPDPAFGHGPTPAGPLRGGGGGGTLDDMDAWRKSIEGRLEKLEERIDKVLLYTLGAFAAGFVVLGGLILNRTDAAVEKLSARIETVSEKVSATQADVAVLKARSDPKH